MWMRHRTTWTLIVASCLAAPACNRAPDIPLPNTYPVTGTVVDSQGRPVTEGFVEFQSTTDHTMKAVGDLHADGRFSLNTLVSGQKVPGAIEGTQKVTVHPFNLEDHGALPIPLDETFDVEPKENEFTLRVGAK